MSTFKISKVLSALPDPLEANTVYLVRVGSGMDIYATDSAGSLVYKVNRQLGSPLGVLGPVAGVVTIDLSLGECFFVGLNANATFSFVNTVGAARCIQIDVLQTLPGGFTLPIPDGWRKVGNTDTVIKSAGGATTRIVAFVDGIDPVSWSYTMAEVIK